VTDSNTPDPEALAAALEFLNSDAARPMIAAMPEAFRSWLGQVAAAPDAEAAQAALRDGAGQGSAADVEALEAALDAVAPDLTGADALNDGASILRSALQTLDGLRRQAAEAAEAVDLDADEDDTLGPLIGDTLALIADDPTTAAVRDLLATVDGLPALATAFAASDADPAALRRDVTALRKKVAALTEARDTVAAEGARPLLDRLRPLVDRWAAHARRSDRPGALGMLYVQAVVAELSQATAGAPPDPAATEPLWIEVLDRAEAEGDAPIAYRALQRLQAAALDEADYARVGDLAERTAIIAEAAGDPRRAALALLEAALVDAQNSDLDGALTGATDALARAEAIPDADATARAHHALGQIHLASDRPAPARVHFAQVADEGPSPGLRARGLVGLAGCDAATGATEHAVDHARQARNLALDGGDANTYIQAAVVLALYQSNAGDRSGCIDELILARNTVATGVGDHATGAFDHVVAHLAEAWGQDVFDAELEAFKARRQGEGAG